MKDPFEEIIDDATDADLMKDPFEQIIEDIDAKDAVTSAQELEKDIADKLDAEADPLEGADNTDIMEDLFDIDKMDNMGPPNEAIKEILGEDFEKMQGEGDDDFSTDIDKITDPIDKDLIDAEGAEDDGKVPDILKIFGVTPEDMED